MSILFLGYHHEFYSLFHSFIHSLHMSVFGVVYNTVKIACYTVWCMKDNSSSHTKCWHCTLGSDLNHLELYKVRKSCNMCQEQCSPNKAVLQPTACNFWAGPVTFWSGPSNFKIVFLYF